MTHMCLSLDWQLNEFKYTQIPVVFVEFTWSIINSDKIIMSIIIDFADINRKIAAIYYFWWNFIEN